MSFVGSFINIYGCACIVNPCLDKLDELARSEPRARERVKWVKSAEKAKKTDARSRFSSVV
jgi:hypothetical protein